MYQSFHIWSSLSSVFHSLYWYFTYYTIHWGEVHYSEDYKPEAIGGQNTEQQVTDSLPDRLVNPDQYRPILPVEGELAHQQDSTESGNHERCLIPVYTYSSVN